MSAVSNNNSHSSLSIVPNQAQPRTSDCLDRVLSTYRKTLEGQYLATYKALALGGKETLESKIIRHAATAPSPISSLPQELARKIFSYLDKRGVADTTSLNQTMKSSATDEANYSEHSSIKSFIEILTKRLNVPGRFQMRTLELKQISKRIVPLNFTNLRDLKGYILGIKTQLIDVLKTLDDETATRLFDNRQPQPSSNIQPPKFMEDIFVLARFESQIMQADLQPVGAQRWEAYKPICDALALAGYIDKAVLLANSILDQYPRFFNLRGICATIARAGDPDKAIALASSIATSIPSEGFRNTALQDISQALVDKGEIDRAINIAMSIPYKEIMDRALVHICQSLITARDFDKAVALASSISDLTRKNTALADISRSLARNGQIDRAVALAISIQHPEEGYRERPRSSNTQGPSNALPYISEVLVAASNFDKAIEVAKLIPLIPLYVPRGGFSRSRTLNDGNRAAAFSNISISLAKNGYIDKAIEVAGWILNQDIKLRAFQGISNSLALVGNIDRALEIATTMISDQEIKSEALKDISRAIVRLGNIDRAVEIAMMIPVQYIKSQALQNISSALLEASNIDKAIEVVALIPDQIVRLQEGNANPRAFVLIDISRALTQVDEIDRAIEVIGLTSDQSSKGVALQLISEYLTAKGNFERGIAVAMLISNVGDRDRIIENIHEAQLADNGEMIL